MPDARLLLRAGGVVRALLGVVGRYRAGAVVGLVLALGWFVVAFGDRADAGPIDAPGVAGTGSGPILRSFGPSLGYLVACGVGFALVALGVAIGRFRDLRN